MSTRMQGGQACLRSLFPLLGVFLVVFNAQCGMTVDPIRLHTKAYIVQELSDNVEDLYPQEEPAELVQALEKIGDDLEKKVAYAKRYFINKKHFYIKQACQKAITRSSHLRLSSLCLS